MPNYFYQVRQGDRLTCGDEGLEFPNQSAAWSEATEACGEMIRELNGTLEPGSEWQMKVTDESGRTVFKLSFVTESCD